MNTELYNQLINQAKRGNQSLTRLFDLSEKYYDKEGEYPGMDFSEYSDAYEAAALEMYQKAMQTAPRDADEAFYLFAELYKNVTPDLQNVFDDLPYVKQAFENLITWFEQEAKFQRDLRKTLLGTE